MARGTNMSDCCKIKGSLIRVVTYPVMISVGYSGQEGEGRNSLCVCPH